MYQCQILSAITGQYYLCFSEEMKQIVNLVPLIWDLVWACMLSSIHVYASMLCQKRIILGMGSVNQRSRDYVMLSLIGQGNTQNDPWERIPSPKFPSYTINVCYVLYWMTSPGCKNPCIDRCQLDICPMWKVSDRCLIWSSSLSRRVCWLGYVEWVLCLIK